MKISIKRTIKATLSVFLLYMFFLTYRLVTKNKTSIKYDKDFVTTPETAPPEHLKNFVINKDTSDDYDDIALCIKSGADVFYDRIPGLLNTYPKYLKNKIIIGEKPGYKVGDYPMYDVCTNNYKEVKDNYWGTDENSDEFKKQQEEDLNKLKDSPLYEDIANARKQDNSKIGWRLDLYKNIPGFKLLYEKFPQAKWYMMVDDDTYVFLSNLKKRLSFYNSDEKLFLGLSWPIPTGCNPTWQGARFAHGGAGIIISRATMLAFLDVYDDCMKSFDECYAGDVRFALCLNKAGIRLNRSENHQNVNWRGHSDQAPNLEYSWIEPCDLPMTFHHLYPIQLKKLYDIQRYNNWDKSTPLNDDDEDGNFKAIISYSDVFNALDLDLKPTEPEKATYRYGSDYKRKGYAKQFQKPEDIMDNMNDCQKMCFDDVPKCKSWQYSNFLCHLKYGIPGAIEGTPNSYTGITGVPITCDGELTVK